MHTVHGWVHASSCIRIARISHDTEFNDEITIERFTSKKKSFNEEKSVYSRVIHAYEALGLFHRYLIEKRKKQSIPRAKKFNSFLFSGERWSHSAHFSASFFFFLSFFRFQFIRWSRSLWQTTRNVWNSELWVTLQDNSFKFRLFAEILSADLWCWRIMFVAERGQEESENDRIE